MALPELSLTEWVVLALVAEAPSHGFAIAKELESESDLGRVLTVHRPLVYRALDRLRAHELVEAATTEPGRGPTRTVMRVTRRGRSALKAWFVAPVEHVRELRIEFLAKLRLTERIDGDPSALVAAQRGELVDRLANLASQDSDDVVDLWRQHNAVAAQAFLDSLP